MFHPEVVKAKECTCRLEKRHQCANCSAQYQYEESFEDSDKDAAFYIGKICGAMGLSPAKVSPPMVAPDLTTRQVHDSGYVPYHFSTPAQLLRRARAAAALQGKSLPLWITECISKGVTQAGL